MAKPIELRVVPEPSAEWLAIELRIMRMLRRVIYTPLIEGLELSFKRVVNTGTENLFGAIRTGRITYRDGVFRGRFNAQISKELRSVGAKWKAKQKHFVLDIENAPIKFLNDVYDAEIVLQKHLSNIDKRLGELKAGDFSMPVSDLFDTALWKVQQGMEKTLRGISVSPNLPPEQLAEIAAKWQNNMDLWIQTWIPEHITELRKTVHKAIASGDRYESLVEGIKNTYGVAERKAKFLARQETNLMLAQFKQTRYMAAGVHEYRWGCVHMPHAKSPGTERPGDVRYYHGILEGQVFRFDDPPVTNRNPERRNNPGQDYNCRCFARPLARF